MVVCENYLCCSFLYTIQYMKLPNKKYGIWSLNKYPQFGPLVFFFFFFFYEKFFCILEWCQYCLLLLPKDTITCLVVLNFFWFCCVDIICTACFEAHFVVSSVETKLFPLFVAAVQIWYENVIDDITSCIC